MVVGHAHPKIVEAIKRQAELGTHFAQPTKHLDVIGENLAERFQLPLWRFANSGTEATLEAGRLMRANTGRDVLIKIEGTYHGHHDSLMFSVAPEPDDLAPASTRTPCLRRWASRRRSPTWCAWCRSTTSRPRAGRSRRTKAGRRHDRRAGDDELRRDPARARLPAGAQGPCHANGAYLAFDEVKTGATLAYGGAVEVFGVVPDVVCLAKAIGGGTPCGAIGATRELYQPIIDGTYDMAGTFNGNPSRWRPRRHAAGGAVPDAYEGFDRIDKAMKDGLTSVIEKTGLPAYVSGVGAKGR